jgi:hypothetical protein
MEKIITPDMLNRLFKANTDLNKLIDLIKEDSMTFDYLRSKDYIAKTVLPCYKSDLNIYDIRQIDDNMVDVETDKFIVTFHRKQEQEGVTQSFYNIVNDIQLGKSAEVEVEEGYMDNFETFPLLKGGYHFIKA